MNFTKTNSNDFTIIKNAIDERIAIIQHKETGFYNITKMLKLVGKLKHEEQKDEPNGIPLGSWKQVKHWFDNQDTTELIEECLQQTKLDHVRYELAAGTPKRFAGTYVHRYLYDHFMSWLDKRYAMKVSVILDHIHQEANKITIETAVAMAIKPKDDKIDELMAKARTVISNITIIIPFLSLSDK